MQYTTAIRGSILTFHADPFKVNPSESYQYIADGLVVIADGVIVSVGEFEVISAELDISIQITDYTGHLITAGFVDAHVHYPQIPMVGAQGAQLLEWLNQYTFPTEAKFSDKEYAREIAKIFLAETLKAGTTTAMVYATVFSESVEAFFEESERLNTRMICGKVMMDRNAPDNILDTAQSAYDDSKALIKKWHGKGRQLYAITPRFAPTSTNEQLTLAGKLYAEYPDVYMQTHLCENEGEIEWVKELFPERESYLDVYDHFGLVGERSVFGHCVHFENADFKTLNQKNAAIAHCPSSNMFLGSGLFDLRKAKTGKHPVKVGVGTDLGAGTSFSQLNTLSDAYKVAQLRGDSMTAIEGFYLATRGGAEALNLEDKIGSIGPGIEADFVVWDAEPTEFFKFRNNNAKSLEESLFAQIILGDERNVKATYVSGECVYESGAG